MWPRGFPLEHIRDNRTFSAIEVRTSDDDGAAADTEVTIVQSLANHDPDVDAIYRLTRKLPIKFQGLNMGATPPSQGTPPSKDKGGYPSLVLGEGVFSPANAQATLYSYKTFWGTLLPVTVHGRVSDIWRSYFTLRLMWDVNQAIAFCHPFAVQHRNPHSYLADFESEQHLYLRAGALTSFLLQWVPNPISAESPRPSS